MEWYNCLLFFFSSFFVFGFFSTDSTCITPILDSCSSTASQRSSLSVTPPKSNLTTYLTPRSSLTPDTTFGDSTAAEYFSFATDSDELNETVTNSTVNSVYETCIGASARLLEATRLAQATRSVRQRLRPLRQASSDFLSRLPKLQHLSIVRASQIDIRGEQATKPEHTCTCKAGLFDSNCLKTFMEMSVQPAEYRNNSQMMTSTPMITKDVYEHGIFNVARIKKVELHDLSPKLPDFHGKCDRLRTFSYTMTKIKYSFSNRSFTRPKLNRCLSPILNR